MKPTDLENRWQIVFGSPFEPSLGIVALVILTLMVIGFGWESLQNSTSRKLIYLRLGLVAILAITILQPTLELQKVRRTPSQVAIIIDHSKSMNLPKSGKSRLEFTQDFLGQSTKQMQTLSKKHGLYFFDLNGPIADTTKLNDTPNSTNLKEALKQTKEISNLSNLAGIVVFSDGADTIFRDGQPLEKRLENYLEDIPVNPPINTVLTTTQKTMRDLSIVNVSAAELGFIHNTMNFEVEVAHVGFNNHILEVRLYQNNQFISAQSIQLDQAPSQKLTFQHKPEKIGEFVYHLEISPAPNEIILSNNRWASIVKIIRDKIRVLHVAGRPSWDERFLRQTLKSNTNIDLISFFILRTPGDHPRASENELSLIPFPTNKIFDTELNSFDVIILQNFDYRPYRMVRYLKNIQREVEKGLSFVMVGGPQAFTLGGYPKTPIEQILPTQLGSSRYQRAPNPPKFTPAGHQHPVFRGSRLTQYPSKNLPHLSKINELGTINSGSTALIIVPNRDGKELPLVAVREYGLGRTMSIATDQLWRWSFAPTSASKSSDSIYQHFWKNTLRWLVRDPAQSRIQIIPSPRRAENTGSINIEISVRDRDYLPLQKHPIQLSLNDVKTPNQVIWESTLHSNEDGVLLKQFEDLPEGTYQISAQTNIPNLGSETQSTVFIKEENVAEDRSLIPKPLVLQKLAERTGGHYFKKPSSDMWEQLATKSEQVYSIEKSQHVPLWDNALILILFLTLSSSEWFLRRKFGYV
ncbi:MAG: glutamine amidotransferase [Myxococcota bacterium]|nr:glutamine amidotransferase [Myxococcota bacterium]